MGLEQKRLKLHEFLCGILGSRNCYYSPPADMQIIYPCIIYTLDGNYPLFADNLPYFNNLRWMITVIDEDPDSELTEKMMKVPQCRFDRSFTSDGLNHFVFTLYF